MIFTTKRNIKIIFTKEHKYVFNKDNRKGKGDYLLSVNKIKKNLFEDLPIVLNQTQVFVLNFEVQKMFNKALTITNKKYTDVIYINSELNPDVINNIINYLEKNYDNNVCFEYVILDKGSEFEKSEFNSDKIKIYND